LILAIDATASRVAARTPAGDNIKAFRIAIFIIRAMVCSLR